MARSVSSEQGSRGLRTASVHRALLRVMGEHQPQQHCASALRISTAHQLRGTKKKIPWMGPNWGWWSICETSGSFLPLFVTARLARALKSLRPPQAPRRSQGLPRAEFAGQGETTELWAALDVIMMHGESPPSSSILDPVWSRSTRHIDIAACRLSAAGFALHRRVPRPVHAYATRSWGNTCMFLSSIKQLHDKWDRETR